MRPKKTRWVDCCTDKRCFKPVCKSAQKIDEVTVTLDEFEAMRLADFEGMRQVDAAKLLKVSRPTFSRIIESARKKVTDGLLNLKMIKIEGGCCNFKNKKIKGGGK